MTTPEPFPGRPVPDVADLRLLGEIINNGAIGLPQAAWSAGMSQSEAAARLVTMAERGMPLRLVAEGDRQQLWQIAQAGPVQPFPVAPPVPPLSAAPPLSPAPAPFPSPPAAFIAPDSADPTPSTGPIGTVSAATPGGIDADAAPAAAVPAEESPRVSTVKSVSPAPEPNGDQSAVWGMPGTSSWVRPPDGEPAQPTAGTDAADQAEPGGPVGAGDSTSAPAEAAATTAPDDSAPPAGGDDPGDRSAGESSAPTRRVLTSGQPVQAVEGLFGEQLDVGLQQILDPADGILTAVGYRIDAGERALLVQTSVGNRGPADYESLADLYLEVVDSAGTVLRKAAMSVNGYPAHQVGVPANTLVSGWTVFLVPVDTEVAQVRWSVRPDLAHRTVSWGFGPAPVDRN